MVDTPVTTPAPVESVAPPAPVTTVDPAAVAAAPVVSNEASPAPPVAPVVANSSPALTLVAPAPEAAPAPTLLTEAPKAPETAPVEPAKAPEVAPQNTEGGQSAEPAPPPTYDPFVLPEGVTLDEGRIGEFTKLLSGLELEGKADHVITQQVGQKLVDFHINEIKTTIDRINEQAMTTWNNQLNTWKEETLKDPVIGGERFEATLSSALEFIRTHGGSEDEQKELRSVMDSSGLGNHKAVIRVFANAMTAMKEGRPLLAQTPPAPPKSRVATMYGSNS